MPASAQVPLTGRLAVAEPHSRGRGTHHPRGESRIDREGRPALAQPDSSPRRPRGSTWGMGVRRTVGSHAPAGAGIAPEPVHRHRVRCTRGPVHGARWCAGAGGGAAWRPDALGLAVLATGPFVANTLALFAGRLGARSPRSLATVRALGGLALVLMLPLAGPVALAGLVLLFWITVALAAPYQMRLWGVMYPPGARGRLIGVVGTGRSAAARHRAARGGCAGGPDRRPRGRREWRARHRGTLRDHGPAVRRGGGGDGWHRAGRPDLGRGRGHPRVRGPRPGDAAAGGGPSVEPPILGA